MNFVDFLFNNYELLFELIGLGIILFISVHVPSKIRHYTRMAIILLIISTAAYNLELWTQSFDKLNMWRAVFTGIKYSVYPVVLMYLIQIVAYVDRPILRKLNYILIIPWAVSVPIFFTTQWTHIICYYTEDNVYMAGTIPYLPYIVFGL